ncbi:hypothetical protein Z968_02125 [Clostridium novyi A str. 4552]|uniref:Uncharacterized protein n=1 Tax=Clostridium novyi A str. 4552 TaxID=1444289 RepID=A0A0A0IDY7_CLONO|nr:MULTISPECIES: hypothetical protein [Clostridium]KGM97820.1 hypothetical protein Z968_02125 [Clostridium novyi A str. 4552]NEZ48508.1 hypothetical protein [Clostridium botulinum]
MRKIKVFVATMLIASNLGGVAFAQEVISPKAGLVGAKIEMKHEINTIKRELKKEVKGDKYQIKRYLKAEKHQLKKDLKGLKYAIKYGI